MYWLTWKQEQNPLLVPKDSKDNLLTGDYYYYGVSPSIANQGSLLDFGGLGLSEEDGVLLDGRSSPWFAVGVTELFPPVDRKIPAWRTKDENNYLANTTILYVWKYTECGSWIIPSFSPTKPPTPPPSDSPTPTPTTFPTEHPTKSPTTGSPSKSPSPAPSKNPSPAPSKNPSAAPTINPTPTPTTYPTPNPSSRPTEKPTLQPTFERSPVPTVVWTGIKLDSSNDNQFLYMLAGFSVGGFLVVCFILILCWMRLDGSRSEEMRKTMVEIERIRSSRIRSLEDKAGSQPRDFLPAPAPPLRNNLSLSRVSPNYSSTHPGHIVLNSSPSILIDGKPSISRTSGYQLPIESTRSKYSVSKSKSYIPSPRSTSRGQEDSSRMELSYPSILPVIQMPMELSLISGTTTDEASIIRRRRHRQRRSSLSPRVGKRGRRKTEEEVRSRVTPADSSESESDSSQSSSLGQKKTSTARRKSKGLLEDAWSKGQSEAYLHECWSDEDPAPEPRKWRRELSRDTHSVRSLRSVDEHTSLRPIAYRTPSVTYSETSHQKDTSVRDLSLYLVPQNGD